MPCRMKNNQRKAMFAKMSSQAKINNRHLKFKHPLEDTDKDGVINMKDCVPLDKNKQGIIHDLIEKKQQFEKKRSRRLEEEQDLLLMRIDKESTSLKKAKKVQDRILENKVLKQRLADLKRANFQQTKAGKIVVQTRRGLIKIGEVTRAGAKLAWKKYKKNYL